MQIVVDTNMMDSLALKEFLIDNPQNTVLLTDQVSMEVFKVNARQSVLNRWKVLRLFPDQVFILKTNYDAALADWSEGMGVTPFLDEEQTEGVRSEFVTVLRRLETGDDRIERDVLKRQGQAAQLMVNITSLADGLEDNVQAFKCLFTAEQLKIIKKSSIWTDQIWEKFGEFVHRVAHSIILSHPELSHSDPSNCSKSEFILRHSLVYSLYIVALMKEGGGNRSKKKAPNDLTDINVVTFATFSDGLMSNDDLTNILFNQMRHILINGKLSR